jgi:hypothetical protein
MHTIACIYIDARTRASVSFCLSFLFFLLLSYISIDEIASSGIMRAREGERKFDDDDVYSMASCVCKGKKKAQKSVTRERTTITIL